MRLLGAFFFYLGGRVGWLVSRLWEVDMGVVWCGRAW